MSEGLSTTMYQPFARVLQKTASRVTAERVAWAVIAFGILLRAAEYFANSALYIDEGALALNVINRSFWGLIRPLDSNQAAPLGFLLLEKLAVVVFGNSEYSLRLFPFLSSVAALFLFYSVARRILTSWAVAAALLFFASANQSVYYGAQAKQYSSDVAIALLIAAAGFAVGSSDLTARRATAFALLGLIVVWISHPSVFVLAGVGLTLAFSALKRRQWTALWTLVGCYAIWLASFALFYSISLSNLGGNQRLEASWMKKGTFMPLPPTSLPELRWFPETFLRVFSNPVASPFPLAAGLLFVLGAAALWKKNKSHFSMMISPMLLTLLASGLHKYPFGRRLLLFLLPSILIVLVAGVEYIATISRRLAAAGGLVVIGAALFQLAAGGLVRPSTIRLLVFVALVIMMIAATAISYRRGLWRLCGGTLAVIILALLLLQPAGGAASNMLRPPPRDDIRPVLAYVRDRRMPGDILYVYYHQKESFQYYAPRYGFTPNEYVLGVDEREHWLEGRNEAYERDLEQLRNEGRVWFLFSYVRTIGGVNEEEYLEKYLEGIGTKLDGASRAGASAHLFDLRPRNESGAAR